MTEFDPKTAKYVSLVTYRKSGVEVRTPVWIAPWGEKHYVFSEPNAGKMKRLKNNPNIKIALCNYAGKLLEETWLSGKAKKIDNQAIIDEVYGSFTDKYGLVMRLTNLLSKISGRYHKRAIIEIILD